MTPVAKSLASTVTLGDGVVMPLFGLGTSKAREGAAVRAVVHALRHGYLMVDTAQRYGNETQVGEGLLQSGVDRQDVFLVTKQWEFGKKETERDFHASLKRLKTSYVDLFLIHSPLGISQILETYDALLKLKESGYVRSVGVSNFNIHHLEGLRKAGRPMPSVNQIELHPFQRKTELVDYCKDHGIIVMGYSPLAKGGAMEYKPLVDMATKCKKSVAQVMIRWSVQKGYITIPKSATPANIESNTDVFDWNLDDEDMQLIEQFPSMKVAWETEDTPWMG